MLSHRPENSPNQNPTPAPASRAPSKQIPGHHAPGQNASPPPEQLRVPSAEAPSEAAASSPLLVDRTNNFPFRISLSGLSPEQMSQAIEILAVHGEVPALDPDNIRELIQRLSSGQKIPEQFFREIPKTQGHLSCQSQVLHVFDGTAIRTSRHITLAYSADCIESASVSLSVSGDKKSPATTLSFCWTPGICEPSSMNTESRWSLCDELAALSGGAPTVVEHAARNQSICGLEQDLHPSLRPEFLSLCALREQEIDQEGESGAAVDPDSEEEGADVSPGVLAMDRAFDLHNRLTVLLERNVPLPCRGDLELTPEKLLARIREPRDDYAFLGTDGYILVVPPSATPESIRQDLAQLELAEATLGGSVSDSAEETPLGVDMLELEPSVMQSVCAALSIPSSNKLLEQALSFVRDGAEIPDDEARDGLIQFACSRTPVRVALLEEIEFSVKSADEVGEEEGDPEDETDDAQYSSTEPEPAEDDLQSEDAEDAESSAEEFIVAASWSGRSVEISADVDGLYARGLVATLYTVGGAAGDDAEEPTENASYAFRVERNAPMMGGGDLTEGEVRTVLQCLGCENKRLKSGIVVVDSDGTRAWDPRSGVRVAYRAPLILAGAIDRHA